MTIGLIQMLFSKPFLNSVPRKDCLNYLDLSSDRQNTTEEAVSRTFLESAEKY